MGNIRKAAVAGTFYSASPEILRQEIQTMLKFAGDQSICGQAIIAPHAGFIYSGPISASVYKPLIRHAKRIKKVILIGPSHYVSFMGLAVPSSECFETPLGKIPVDSSLKNKALEHTEVVTMDHAHLQEHSLEVHLPFLQETLDDFSLLPIIIGETSPNTIADVLDTLWNEDDTLIISSTDLSHYMTYESAKVKDQLTTDAIISNNLDGLDHHNACGLTPLSGLCAFLKRHKLKPKLIDLRNSGDTSGEKDRVVGYASFICDNKENLTQVFSRPQQHSMLQYSRKALENKLLNSTEPNIKDFDIPDLNAACFITLKKNDVLRGCIGSLKAHRKLSKDILNNTYSAAFKDPRFPVLRSNELQELEISISILSPAETINFSSEADLLEQIRPGIDGLILTLNNNRGTFLPSVWEEIPDKKLFLQYLKEKAGLAADFWSDSITVEKYTSICFQESQFN